MISTALERILLAVVVAFSTGCSGPDGSGGGGGAAKDDAGNASAGASAGGSTSGGRSGVEAGGSANPRPSSGGRAGAGGGTGGAPGGGAANDPDASTGAGGAPGAGGASGAGGATDRDVVCPAEPPFDESDAALVEECTRPVAVAVGNALRRLITFDGANWQYEAAFPDGGQDQNENSHRDVAIANGVVVITGDGGVLASRDAGATYEKVIDVRNHDSAIAVFRGAFWIVGTQVTATSIDGFTWQKWQGDTQVPGGLRGGWDTTSLAASGDRLVAVTGRNDARRVFDGSAWTEAPFDSEYRNLSALAFGGGRFALVGFACCDQDPYAGLRASSANGADWAVKTNASASTGYRFGDVLWDGARFLATASQYDRRVFFSDDGLDYVEEKSSHGVGAAARFDGRYLGANDGALLASPDAKTWTETYRATDADRWGITKIRTGRVLE